MIEVDGARCRLLAGDRLRCVENLDEWTDDKLGTNQTTDGVNDLERVVT